MESADSQGFESFDLVRYLQLARQSTCPKRLFSIWEDCCRRYDRREIGRYELDEMKEVIWPMLSALASLRRIINGTQNPQKSAVKRRA